MKIIFIGSSKFSTPALRAIASSEHKLVGVITNPEKPAGRGLKNRPTPVAELAGQYKIDILTPTTLRNNSETVEWIKHHTPDAIIVAAYGKFIPPDVLYIPAHGCLNLHPSLLPKYRGAAPIQRAIMNNEKKTGVTIMLLDKGMDSGPIFMQREMDIDLADDAVTLGEKLSRLGADMLLKTLYLIEQKQIEPVAQQHELATLAPKINREEGKLDFNRLSIELHNIVRALIEWPTAWTIYNGKILQVLSTEPVAEKSVHSPATIVKIDEFGIHTATGDGILIIKSVKPSGSREMDAMSYANGRRIKPGDVLG